MGRPSHVRRDGCHWFVGQRLPRRLLDVNPAPGFDYEFNSIEDDTNELFCAYKEMFELAVSQNKNRTRQLLGIYFPIIDVIFVSEFHHTSCGPCPY